MDKNHLYKKYHYWDIFRISINPIQDKGNLSHLVRVVKQKLNNTEIVTIELSLLKGNPNHPPIRMEINIEKGEYVRAYPNHLLVISKLKTKENFKYPIGAISRIGFRIL